MRNLIRSGIFDDILGFIDTPGARRSVEDRTIPYLRPKNYAQPFLHLKDNIQTRLIAIVEIRTANGFVPYTIPEVAGEVWNLVKPFGKSSDVFYYKYLGNIKLDEATRIIAREVMDYMYRVIFVRNKPIIAIRVILIDWNTGKPVDPKLLQDKWYSNIGFDNYKIDKFTLKHWGIDIGDFSPDSNQRMQYKYSIDNEFKTRSLDENELKRLFDRYKINIESLSREAFQNIQQKLPNNLKNSVRNRIRDKLQSIIISIQFKKEVMNIVLDMLKNDRKFRDKFVTADNKSAMIKEIIYNMINNIIKKESV